MSFGCKILRIERFLRRTKAFVDLCMQIKLNGLNLSWFFKFLFYFAFIYSFAHSNFFSPSLSLFLSCAHILFSIFHSLFSFPFGMMTFVPFTELTVFIYFHRFIQSKFMQKHKVAFSLSLSLTRTVMLDFVWYALRVLSIVLPNKSHISPLRIYKSTNAHTHTHSHKHHHINICWLKINIVFRRGAKAYRSIKL